MRETYDAIVVGGGHNGLTAAGYLGKAGLKTLVLERRPIVGGAAVTEEIHPGFRVSSVSYVVSLLRSEVIRDLELKRHGFEMLALDGTLAVCGDDYVFLTDDEEHDRKEVERFSTTDYGAIEQFDAMIQEIGAVLRNQMLREPPKLDAGLRDIAAFASMGLDIRKLSPEQRYRLAQPHLKRVDNRSSGNATDLLSHPIVHRPEHPYHRRNQKLRTRGSAARSNGRP